MTRENEGDGDDQARVVPQGRGWRQISMIVTRRVQIYFRGSSSVIGAQSVRPGTTKSGNPDLGNPQLKPSIGKTGVLQLGGLSAPVQTLLCKVPSLVLHIAFCGIASFFGRFR